MPIIKKTKLKEVELKKAKAQQLYSKGFTTREIAKIVSRSRSWVSVACRKKQEPDKKNRE